MWYNMELNKKKIDYEGLLKKILIITMVASLLLIVVGPLLKLFETAFFKDGSFIGFDNFSKYLSDEGTKNSLTNTLYISTVTTVITLVLAFSYAYSLSRSNMRFKSIFKFLALLPIFAPTMMYGMSLVYIFGNKGLFTVLTGINIDIYGPLGIILSEIIYTFPQAFLILYVALRFSDNRLYEAGEALGASNLKKFWNVTLPSVKYAVISATFVIFTLSFTDFGAPKVVGGNYSVLALDVFKQVVGQQDMSMGATVGILLLIPTVLSFVIDKIANKKEQEMTISAKSTAYVIKKNTARDVICQSYCIIVALVFAAIIFMVFFSSIVKLWPYDFTLTLEHYKMESSIESGLESFKNSLIVAFLSALLGTMYTFVNAYLIEKVRDFKFLRRVAELISMIPMAVPGLVIGLSYIFFFNSKENPFNFIYGTIWILVLSNIFHFYSVPFLTSTTSLKKLDRELEWVGESLKVPFYKIIGKVTVPLSIEAILENFMYFFTNSMVTISAVIFLYTPAIKLSTVTVVNLDDSGATSEAASLASLIIITNLIVRFIYEMVVKYIGKRKERLQGGFENEVM